MKAKNEEKYEPIDLTTWGLGLNEVLTEIESLIGKAVTETIKEALDGDEFDDGIDVRLDLYTNKYKPLGVVIKLPLGQFEGVGPGYHFDYGEMVLDELNNLSSEVAIEIIPDMVVSLRELANKLEEMEPEVRARFERGEP